MRTLQAYDYVFCALHITTLMQNKIVFAGKYEINYEKTSNATLVFN